MYYKETVCRHLMFWPGIHRTVRCHTANRSRIGGFQSTEFLIRTRGNTILLYGLHTSSLVKVGNIQNDRKVTQSIKNVLLIVAFKYNSI
jgi:hypothetical protein